MKIIKVGIVKPKEIVVTCVYCQTEFSYEKEDVKPDNRDGDYVECPVCKKSIASKI